MREILFRGKRIDNGEWVYGYLVKVVCATGSEWHINVNAKDPDDYHKIYIVDSETVCQFTGMTDRNGNKIFEGDVVSAWSQGVHAKGKIAQRIDGYWIMYPSYQENIMWYLAPDADGKTDIEIIGNIHDGV